MFPASFVREQVEAYSEREDWVFDPFCGRGTTILESLLLGRNAAGSDINPVAYCISRAKADRPKLTEVHSRINELEELHSKAPFTQLDQKRLMLPQFFRRAFYHTTLHELLFLRDSLNWHRNKADRFIAALILGSLHGEVDRSSAYFSNQMPRTICLKPNYSLRYWRKHKLFPRKRDVFDMLRQKADYRLQGMEGRAAGEVRLSDVRDVASHFRSLWRKVALVVTSPPYLNVTCYEEDQWLRLWFLGGLPHPTYGRVSKDDRHGAASKYWQFLEDSWTSLAPLLKDSAKVVIRLGAIGLDENEMTSQLKNSFQRVFPRSRLLSRPRCTEIVGRQANNFLPSSKGCRFEIDYVLSV